MASLIGGSRKKTGTTDADIYFDIEDEKAREAFRQLYDNSRALEKTNTELKKRVEDLEQTVIDIEAQI